MTKANDGGRCSATDLRCKAEQRLEVTDASPAEAVADADARAVVHELQVRQMELEMQNEELLRAQAAANQALQSEIAARKRAEEALREIEERLLLTLSAGRLATWDWHLPTDAVIWNDEHFRMLGYEPGAAKPSYQAWAERIHPDDRPVIEAKYRQSLEQGGDYAVEFRSLWPNGTVRWIEARGRVERDAAGQPIRSYGVMLDMTERETAEEQLRRQAEEIEKVLDVAPVAVWLARDPECRNVVGNVYADQIMQAPRQRNISAIAPPGQAAVSYKVFRQGVKLMPEEMPAQIAAATGKPVTDEEIDLHFPDGRVLHLLSSAVPLFDQAGRVRGVVSAAADTTQRKRAEDALRESEQLYRAIGESIDYGVWVCDPEGRNIYASESFLKLVGITQQQCSDFGWGDVLHPDDAEHTIAAWKECVRTGGTWDIEHRFRGVDGQWHPILARGVPVRNEQGQITCWAGINLDISSLKQAEEQLKSLNETLEQQVADRTAESHQRAIQLRAMVAELSQAEQRERRRLSQVLHDHLQQLLVAARMKVRRLRRRAGEDDALAKIADEVDELIDQCIGESRSLTVELSPPVLYDGGLAAGLDWLARRVEEQHGLPIEVAVIDAADPASMDLRVFLFQAVRELLFNVVKHANATQARISMAKTEDGGLRIEVRDDGVGCDLERLASRSGHGGGFGLFNVRERLELLGGRLEIDTAPGTGVQVGIVIPPRQPVTADDPAGAQTVAVLHRHGAPTPGTVSRSEGGLRVLLADDHPVVRKGLADLLREQAGIEVVIEARDGKEAVDLALEARPDVVILDITMPRMNGIEATRRIKAELPQVRVIGLSMHEDANMARAMCEAGASDYLRKDISSDALIAAVLCHTPRAQD